jgi:hypothetical protein
LIELSVQAGTVAYTFEGNLVSGVGVFWSDEEFEDALNGSLVDIVFDSIGTSDVTTLLESILGTDFDYKGIQRVFDTVRSPENWRVGEAIGEEYLCSHRSCSFPWSVSRDERKSGSSLPGADLVGFEHVNDSSVRFAFGEVKTSSEPKYPPGVMYGRTGLKQQLEDLRDKVEIRDTLVKYLAFRAINASWKNTFASAFGHYNSSNTDVRLYGILVRDVPHEGNDLSVRATKLSNNCPEDMRIHLIAIYLPIGEITNLSSKIMAVRHRGNK